jgi:ribose transport system substrate-binding protein
MIDFKKIDLILIKPPKMKIHHILYYTLAGTLLSLVSVGFSQTKENAKPLNLAFLTNNASDYWTTARAGVQAGAKEVPNVHVDFRIPASGTAAEQTQIFNDLIAKGTQGIAISPVSPDNQTPLLNTGAKKALIVTQDSDAPKSDRSFYIGTDNVAAGRQLGELIKKALPDGGKIMMFVGLRDAQNAAERAKGIEEALKGTKIQIVDTRTDNTDRARARQNVSDTLVRYPDIGALVGLWSYNGPAIYNAVKAANQIGKVKILCFDAEAETLAGLKAGAITATIVQQPYEFGRLAVVYMSKVLRKESLTVPASKQFVVPTKAITPDNVTEYMDYLHKLGVKGS